MRKRGGGNEVREGEGGKIMKEGEMGGKKGSK